MKKIISITKLDSIGKDWETARLIDPLAQARKINARIFGEPVLYTDRPILPSYNLLRPRMQDRNLGPELSIDPLGCPYACAFCWVHPAALAGSIESHFVQNKLREKTGAFKGELINDANAVFDAALKKIEKNKSIGAISMTGAETTTYRGAILTMAKRAQQHGILLNIDTMGLQIVHCPEYLDAFEGLQGTLHFYVSIKHVDKVEFGRLTGVQHQHMDDAFIAIKKLLERGFDVIPGGIILDTFATASNLKDRPNHITRLYDRLAEIHSLLPSMLAYDKMNRVNVHDAKGLAHKMHARGYVDSTPMKVKQAIESYWLEHGTPIIKTTVETPSVIAYRSVWDQIKQDMSRQERAIPCNPQAAIQ